MVPKSKTFWKGMLLIGILGVSFAAIFIRMSNAHPIAIAAWRMLFTVIILAPFTIVMQRKELLSLKPFDLMFMGLIGIVLALHFAFWNTSLQYTEVAPATLIVTSHPIFVALISHYVFKERLGKFQAFGIGMAFCGAIILVLPQMLEMDFTSNHFIGAILALVAAFAAGAYYMSGRKVRQTRSLLTYVFVVYSVCTVVLFGIAFGGGVKLAPLPWREWGLFLLLALVPTILGHTIHNLVLKHLETYIVSVSLLGEPIGASILAIFFFQEIPSLYTLFGGLVIIAGIYLTIRGKPYEDSKPKGTEEEHGGRDDRAHRYHRRHR